MPSPAPAHPCVQTWSTDEALRREATDAWEAALGASYGRWDVDRAVPHGFSASLRKRSFGGVRVVECECDPCSGRRLPQVVGREAQAFVGVQITRSGSECFHLGGQALSVGAGDLVIWTSEQPSAFTVIERLHKVSLVLPLADVQKRLPRSSRFTGTVLDSRRGIGAVLYSHVDSLARQLDLFTDEDQAAVERATLELLCAALSHGLEAPSRGLAARYLKQLQDYALRHLQDEDLSPASIAAANHMSPRYVHQLFGQCGVSVSVWIRQQRLERCREALESPAHRHSAVADIAHAWGFSDPAHFARVFRSRYGASPSAWREARHH
ncbi:Transcriptional activator NphR [Xylophilus ampelinus]|nr:helix-turn-helix domain-containing protein [Variovorax sp.]VTY29315.1 Transcriptional activator NphR [Xylophilus ampelinus]